MDTYMLLGYCMPKSNHGKDTDVDAIKVQLAKPLSWVSQSHTLSVGGISDMMSCFLHSARLLKVYFCPSSNVLFPLSCK